MDVSIGFDQSVNEECMSYPCGSQYKIVRTTIDEDITTIAIDGHINEDLYIRPPQDDQYISLCFMLSGKVTSFNQDGTTALVCSKGQGLMVFHRSFSGSTIIHKTNKLSVFSIIMPYNFLRRVFKNTSRKKVIQLLECQEREQFCQKEILLSPQVTSILHQMGQARPKEELKYFFAASKTYELINCCLEQLTQNCHKGLGLSINDISCLKKARTILAENIAEPPSIIQLSRMVGINDCKLKRGFKQLFNTTPFGYVQDLRMTQARHSLLDGMSSVTSVANQVGYTNVGHFSAAFRKCYGTTPGDFKKISLPMIA